MREVRLIDAEGTNHGVVPIEEARDLAREAELDLVEVAPNAKPPVCRIMDYGKFSYEQTRKEREARKRQKKIEIKTIRLTPRTDDFHRGIGVKKGAQMARRGQEGQIYGPFPGARNHVSGNWAEYVTGHC